MSHDQTPPVPGNLRRTTPCFVGRREELRHLHDQLGVGAISVVTAVRGLGGLGKTELAVAYANGHADCYPVGLWSLAAEGRKELLPLLGELAFVPRFGYTPTDAERIDATRLGQGVLAELRRRSEAVRAQTPEKAAALIVLDNVTEAELLGPAQLATLGPLANWLRLVATTQLSTEQLGQVATVAVDALPEADALQLLREHQPEQRFEPAEEMAAREIVRALGGFTLAVAQVAVYLRLAAEAPGAFLKRLRADDLPADQQKQLGPILRTTLDALAREVPAALTALRFAAMLPPDHVLWPWLCDLTTQRHPELAERPAEWDKLKRRLEGLRLLTGGDQPEIGRMHRLVAAHLRHDAGAELAGEMVRHVDRRAEAIGADQSRPADWELDGLLAAVPYLLERHPERALAVAGMLLDETVLAQRTLPVVQALLAATDVAIRRLAAADPDNAELQRDLSVALEKLGDLAAARGDLAEAQRLFAESLTIAQRLAAADPANAEWQRDLFVALINLGDVAVARGDLAEAQRLFSESLASAQRGTADPDNAECQHDRSISLEKLGDVAEAQVNLTEAQRLFTESLTLRQQLAASDAGNAEWQRDLSVALEKLGDVTVARSNLPEAQRLFAESLAIRQRLVATDAGNAEWQRDLSVALEKLGNLAVARGHLAEAQRLFAESIFQRLTTDAGNVEWQRDLSVSLEKLGDVAVAEGNAPVALRLFTESLTLRQRLVAIDAGNAEWQRDLSISLEKLGNLAVAQGNLAEAQRLFAESLAIRQRLTAADPANAEWQRDLSVALEKLGDVVAAEGNLPVAQNLFAESIFQRLAADAGNSAWQRDLSVSLEKLGDVAVARNNLAEAQRLFTESLAIRQSLVASDAGNAEWQRDLWVAHWRVANVLEQQGVTAAEHWRRAHDILAGLVQAGLHVVQQDRDYLDLLRAKIAG